MASKSSKTYWVERAAIREKESYLRGAELSDALFRQYELAAASVRREISDFYAKYAAKYEITYDDAVRLLTKAEMREWKRTLEEYQAEINATTDQKVKTRLTARLDALSTNSQITRLETLEGKIDLTLNRLYDRGVSEMKRAFGALFTEAYYKKHYDIQSRANIFAEIADINEEVVENVLSYPWSGAMFSDRLWKNKEQLLFSTRQILTQGCIQGKSIDAMTQALAGQMGQSYKAAERLIRTETSHFHNEASKQAYEAAGIDEYEFLASLSERTCEVCGELDHQHFPRKDAITGTNYPPMHPNCRCTTISYDPDREKIYQMSGIEMSHEMTYAEWRNCTSRDELKNTKVQDNVQEKQPLPAAGAPAPKNTGGSVEYNSDASFEVNISAWSRKTNECVSEMCAEVARLGGMDNKEHLRLVDMDTGQAVYAESGDATSVGGVAFWNYIKENSGKRLIFLHNHNTDGCFSETDMMTLLKTSNIKGFIAVRRDGVIYVVERIKMIAENATFDHLFKDELRDLNILSRNGIIDGATRTRKREEIIVNTAIERYTKGLIEIDTR